jgi:4-amino-4-deoxy-L-arabinose transferase-like glycosyltransferase
MISKTDVQAFFRRHLFVLALLTAFIAAAILYFARVPAHPAGFYIDESSICYNAYTISQTGRDEYGNEWPLFFRAFGEYKNPTFIYLVAAVFRITGPSIAIARLLSATLGIAAAFLLGLLALRLTNRRVAFLVVLTALLTPWLFELSRVVLEVSLYPFVLVLFLLCVYRGSQKLRWSWIEILLLAITLALITYTYSIGRLLGPLLALGLIFFVRRGRRVGLLLSWGLYALTLAPLFIFQRGHPGALSGRFSIITYVTRQNAPSNIAWEFIKHYFGNFNPWRLFVTGDPNPYQITHLYGAELLLAVTGLLSVAGLLLVFRHQSRDPWWRFVVYGVAASVVPASLTNEYVHTLRLVPLAIFLIVLSIPALEWLTKKKSPVLVSVLVLLILAQGAAFQWRFHANAHSQKRRDLFDNAYPETIFAKAVTSSQNTIYLADAQGIPGYIQAYWYATLRGVPIAKFTRLAPDASAPVGALVISTEAQCLRCEIIATSDFYKLYLVTERAPERQPLPDADFRASLRVASAPSVVKAGEQFSLQVSVKNEGNSVWLAQDRTGAPLQVSLGNHWLNREGRLIVYDDGRNPLLADIKPGEEVELLLTVNAPNSPGEYLIELDMLQEGVSWFALRGSPTVRLQVKVEKRWWD